METRANYVIVGLFTIVAILAAFGFVYWTAAVGQQGETVLLRVRIPGSASGLGQGSAVLFNGVKVGEVKRVYLDLANPKVAIADTQVDRLTPITKSTKADVGLAGLTGQANIELNGGSSQEPNILDQAESQDEIAEITANPSAVTNLLQTAQSILTRADTVVSQLEGFVGDARQPLTQTVRNIQTFSDALAKNADGIDQFLASAGKLSKTLSGVSDQLNATLKAAEGLLNSVDREKVRQIVGNVSDVTRSLKTASDNLGTVVQHVDETVTSVNKTAQSIGTFSQDADKTLDKVTRVIDSVDPADVRTALSNFAQASTTVNKAANDVSKITDDVSAHRDDINAFIANSKQLSERLNRASTRVDGILAKVDKLLSSDNANGLIGDARDTLKSFKQVADTLNARLGVITQNLANFTGPGLGELRGLVRDTKRSINRIERTITDFGQNPQRIITGGKGEVPKYNGRRRR